jgi:hypothetical protein
MNLGAHKHMLVCLALVVLAVTGVGAGFGATLLLVPLACALMMGAMMWMMIGAGRRGHDH